MSSLADQRRRQRERIDGAVSAWMNEPGWEFDESRFDRLARELFSHQFESCGAYARFCRSRGAEPKSIRSWKEIPAVPTGAFKEMRIASFPEANEIKTFRTSGTSTQRRGELHLDTLELYETSLLASLSRFVFPDLRPSERMTLRILAPSASEAPDSSLSHMFSKALEIFGSTDSGYDVVDGTLQTDALCRFLERAQAGRRPVALCGTAFAFVHLLDELEQNKRSNFQLPAGSRVMETGGYKGRSRELARDTLHSLLARRLGVAASNVVNQYGMTELGSQFYDSSLRQPDQTRRKLGPPWTRLRLVDPETGSEAKDDASGMVILHDLANTGSIAAIQTADIGRRSEDGFEILGREPDAEERGCSIAADVMLGESAPK